MITPFAKVLRKIRLERNLKLKDMADALACSSPFLSGLESGKKNIPSSLIYRIAAIYSLREEEISALREGALLSQKEIRFDLTGRCEKDRELIIAFAKNFTSLTEQQKINVYSVLNKKKETRVDTRKREYQ